MAVEYLAHLPGQMRVRFLQSVVAGGEPHAVGDVADILSNEAYYLLGRGAVEKVLEPVVPPEPASLPPAAPEVKEVRAQVLPDASSPAVPPHQVKMASPQVKDEKAENKSRSRSAKK